ncbi:MAG: hypothetical protein OXF56_15040 [Rhodobacteraceae bacterium]|nr:hypothetical protein [Paracoccaceae bacterium]
MLGRPGSHEWRALASLCQEQLEAVGPFNLAGFMRESVVDTVLQDAVHSLETQAFLHSCRHNTYLGSDPPKLPDDHSPRHGFERSNPTL